MNYKFKTKPYAHQLTALEKSWDKTEYGYFMEMGTGKSKVVVKDRDWETTILCFIPRLF